MWDLPPAWSAQLAPGGRLVVPLRWRGQTRSVAFTHHDAALRSDSVRLCGFVPMVGHDGEHTAPLDPAGHTTLTWDTDQPIDPAALHNVLDQTKVTLWSGVTVGGEEPFDGVWLRLTATEPATCRIAADRDAVDSGVCTPAIPSRSPALLDTGSLAYLTLRRVVDPDTTRWELGAVGHGPDGTDLANRICQQVHAWNNHRDATATITARPAGAGPAHAGPAIHKPHTTLTVDY
jgi:protein-L-isoaspartate(D-aspartate) O-methyltransferase